MDDLDKLARELLARQYDCDVPGSGVAQKLRGDLGGQLRVADLIALAAIRAALMTAPPGWRLVPVEPTPLMIATFRADNANGAMSWMTHTTLRCADFSSRYAGMIAAAPEVK